MTNQEAYDGVMKWLTRPNAKRCSTAPGLGAQCVYYDPITENRCAIGGHLPLDIAKRLKKAAIGIQGILNESEDDLYDVENLDLELIPFIKDYYDGVDVGLLDSLQRMHDSIDAWGAEGFIGWTEADRIAEEFNLNRFIR